MGKFVDLTGKRYGRLVFECRDYTSTGKSPAYRWFVVCDCGTRKSVFAVSVTRGLTKSCGCMNREYHGGNRRHGGSSSTEYNIWCSMRQRCNDPKSSNYARYGARGITVDPSWDSFEVFLSDMVHRPSPNHSLDRIKNSEGYSNSNCKWSTAIDQTRNKRSNIWVRYQGREMVLADLAVLSGRKRGSVYHYHSKGRLEEIIPGAVVIFNHLPTAFGGQG